MKSITGAILILAGAVNSTADGLANDLALIPVLIGFGYLLADMITPSRSANEPRPRPDATRNE